MSEFAGKEMYIGFLHYDCDGSTANGIRIDNVELMNVASLEEDTISLGLYPNPVEDKLVILSDNDVTNISLYTINGAMIYDGKYGNDGVDVSNLKAGTYFVNVRTANYEVLRRFVKK